MDPASAGTPPLTIGDHPEGSHASGSGPGKPPMPYARVAWDHLGQMATPARPDIRRSLRLPTDLARSSDRRVVARSEEHTSELQSLMRTSYAVFSLKKNPTTHHHLSHTLQR